MRNLLYRCSLCLLVLLLAATTAWANGRGEDTEGGPVTLTWMTPEMEAAPFQQDFPVVLAIEEATGVNLDIEVGSADDGEYTQKATILIASAEVPDIMFLYHGSAVLKQVTEAGPNSPFAALDELIVEHAPNLQSYWNNYPAVNVVGGSPVDGQLYVFPTFDLEAGNYGTQWHWRADLAEEMGLDTPVSTEDFYEVASAFKERFPDSYPITSRKDQWTLRSLSAYFIQAFTGVDTYDAPYGYSYADDDYQLITSNPGFKDAMEYMNRLMEDGLLDPEYLTNTEDSMEQKVLTDQVFLVWQWRTRGMRWEAKSSQPGFSLLAMAPFAAPGQDRFIQKRPMVSDFEGFGIARDGTSLEAAIRVLDFMASDRGIALTNWGVEGQTYETTSPYDDILTAVSDGHIDPYEGYDSSATSNDLLRANQGARRDGLRIIGVEELAPIDARARLRNEIIEPFLVDPPPLVPIDEDLNQLIRRYSDDIRTTYAEAVARFVFGNAPITDAAIEALDEELKRLNAGEIAEKMDEAYNEAYK